MAEILLVNPRKRSTKSRKRRSAAQKRATAKMLAANRSRRRTTRRAGSSKALTVRRRRRSVPTRRTGASTRRRYARNPISGLGLRGLTGQLTDAGIMAGSAFGLDVLMGFAMPYIPADSPLRTFPGRHAMKGVAALGLGIVAGMVVKNSTAKTIATGALANVLVDALRAAKVQYAPDIRLGDADPLGMWMDQDLGYLYEDPSLGGYLTDQSQSQPRSYQESYNSAELVSWQFNTGAVDIPSPECDLRDRLNAGEYGAMREELARWNGVKGFLGRKIEVPGLTNRRRAEADVFERGYA